jgi:hypothetical protein
MNLLPETKMLFILIAFPIVLSLVGCNTTENELRRMATADTAAFCDLARPLYWSRKDTLSTIQQIKLHNATGKICGWSGK